MDSVTARLATAEAVIFDFNGTLSDDEGLLAAIFADLFAEHLGWEMSHEEYDSRYLGRSDRGIVEAAVAEHADGNTDHGDLVERLLALRAERYLVATGRRSPIRRPTLALVRGLAARGTPMAIATGAHREEVRHVLAASGIAAEFGAVVTAEDVHAGKPHPEGFLRAASALGVEPTEALAFEDSLVGVRAASAAGMPCVAVTGERDAAAFTAVGVPVVTELSESLLGGRSDLTGQATPSTTRRT